MAADDWTAACDDLVRELLAEAGLTAPPVDAVALARHFDWPVVWDAGLRERGRLHRLAGRPALFIRPEDRPERVHWAVAHEVGEAQLWRVCDRVGCDPDDLAPRQRETLACQFAQRLLLPTSWFHAARNECGDDLLGLKQRFCTASHELIAWRWLDLPQPRIVSIFDGASLARRRCNFALRPPPLSGQEIACVETARRLQRTARRASTTAWAIHEPAWQREIVRTIVPTAEEQDHSASV
jgi:hypothetical protein